MRLLRYTQAAGATLLLAGACGRGNVQTRSQAPPPGEPELTTMDDTQIPFLTITGETARLSDYPGKALLIVNVASECGYTPQYAGLEELYRRYRERGLVVLGFPANNFGGQEPGTEPEILAFCRREYDVTFPLAGKVSVKGADKHPLFVHLTEHSERPGEIKWNFSKFLLDGEGHLVARFDTKVDPLATEVVEAIEKLL